MFRRLITLIIFIPFCFASPAHPADPSPPYVEEDHEFFHYLDHGLSYLINEKNYEAAVASFESALKIRPKDPAARKGLRLAKTKLKQLPLPASPSEVQTPPNPDAPRVEEDKAYASTSTVVNTDVPDEKRRRIEQHYHAGMVALLDEDYDRAIHEMESILAIEPAHEKARKALQRAYSLKE